MLRRARSFLLTGLFAATTLALGLIPIGSAKADLACSVVIEVVKGGFIVGLGGGTGTLTCGDKSHTLELGGMKVGFLVGISKATFRGPVRHLKRVEDIEGTYAGAGAGIAVDAGAKGVIVT